MSSENKVKVGLWCPATWVAHARRHLAGQPRPHGGQRNQEKPPLHHHLAPELNEHLRTVIVAPMTSKSFAAPFRVPITHAGTKGLVVLDQMRAIDKTRLVKRLGAAPAKTLEQVLHTLQELFAV